MIAAEGCLSVTAERMRVMLSKNSAFQKWVNAGSEADALEAIYFVSSIVNPKPRFCIVDFGQFARDRVKAMNGASFQERAGTALILYFRGDNTASDDDADMSFNNSIGLIWNELEEFAGKYNDRTVFINAIELKVPSTRIQAEDRPGAGDYIECYLTVTYTRQP